MHKVPKLLAVLFFIFFFSNLSAQNFWKVIPEAAAKSINQQRTIIPEHYEVITLDSSGLLAALRTAPAEFSIASRLSPLIISIPMPDGSVSRFNIVAYSMMESGLQAQFPDLLTFSGQGIDDRTATIKLDWTGFGFHAMILSPLSGSVWIDPYSRGDKVNYISYYKKDLRPRQLMESVLSDAGSRGDGSSVSNSVPVGGPCLGPTLRTYRLAIACTGEYAVAVGGTTAALLHSAIVTTVNRVNGVYESEMAIRLVLVSNNNLIEFLNAATDPFTGNNLATTLITESQTQITNRIGSANFDIGHTFSTGGGGLAGVGVVCNDAQKARGITGSPLPVGDAYDIDFVAHEMGHQFGGQHTFNAATGNCSGNGSATSNAEPGSGSTIMAYAGICTTNDLQPHSDPQFHAISFNELGKFTRNANGATCGIATATGNTAPVVNAGNNYTIPVSTPFTLTGSATDADADLLTYSWEQIDVGAAFGNWNAPTGVAPLFRSFAPTLSPSRTFPRISDIANNTTTIGELLPSYIRDINFRLTARDNRAGGGGVCYDEMKVTTAGATAFTVTSQTVATSWVANGSNTATITWSVANTTAAPFNVSNVAILFSTDGGLSFPYTLVAVTPNDGTQTIIIPAAATTKGRVMVKSIGNIFFNINAGNINVTSPCAAEGAIIAPANTVVAMAGDASLNLGLAPQYAVPLTIAGSLTTTDANSSLALLSTVTASCASFSGNAVKYDVYTFTPSINATYTFTLTGTLGTAMNLYSGMFDPANPCAGFLKSNISYDGTSATASTSFSQLLTAGNTYAIAITTFSATQPALPDPYSVAVTSALPAGGTLYAGTSFYFNPGAGFNYAYVIVNSVTGIIAGISATANLTSSINYPAGVYNVYGLSYAVSAATLNTYVGGNLSALTANIFTNPATFCANFSKNFVTVIITGTLPVSLLKLTAQKDKDNVLLNWKTASEQNSSHFNVQRSSDGINFSGEIAVVNAAGNSTSERDYHFTDIKPFAGRNYYRIQEADIDGIITLSNTVLISFDKSGLVLVYPNPAKDQLSVDYNSTKDGNLTLNFIDSKGSLVMMRTLNVSSGRSVNTFDISFFAPGLYILRYIEPDGNVSALKFIKR